MWLPDILTSPRLFYDFPTHIIRILLQASKLRERYIFSFWNSLIVATALSVQAARLISEDMQNGLIIENILEIINSFL